MNQPACRAYNKFILTSLGCAAAVPAQAMACGPGPEVVIFPLVALVWMTALVPVEISIIKMNCGFQVGDAISAYLVLLLAKVLSLLAVWPLLDRMVLGEFGTIDLLYGLIHATISMVLIYKIYHIKGSQLWKTSLLISTAIPWSYRLGLIAIFHAML